MLAAAATLSAPAPARVVRAQEPAATSTVAYAVRFAVSPAVRDLPPDPEFKTEDAVEDVKVRPPKVFRVEAEGVTPSQDEAVQSSAPMVSAIPGPTLSFEGLNSDTNAALLGLRLSPPDTNGDVGPDHYVQIINFVYRVYDKSGIPLIPARKVSSIFATLGGPCATRDDGDPVVLYDPLADRWLISQFCTIADPNNHQVIAVSQTGDPTGAYYLYDFMMPNNKFNDYPKFGVWPDAYYMTDNQFNQAGTAFLGAGVFAFDRAKMLSGDPSASFIYFDLAANPSTAAAGGMLPADVDGLNPPPPGTPGYFAYFTAGEFGDPQGDALRVFDFRADFASLAASTFTERAESPIPVAAFNPLTPAGRDDIEQPAPAVTATASLDSISDRLMFRLAYRNFGGYESLVVNHTVNVGTGTTIATHQAGVRYYELRRSLAGGGFTVNEQATFAPDTDNRWMGSAAMDNQGNLAIGFSVSSLTTFPSIRYAGRLASDPPGGLFQGETPLVAGTGVQTSTGSRWGDYSALSVDPADDCTFWYTTEYYTAASQATSAVGWLTRVGSFKFPACTPAARETIEGVVTNAVTGLPVSGVSVQTGSGYSRFSSASGSYSMGVVPGTYSMTASKAGYTTASASGVVVSGGGATTQNFVLTPIPILIGAGAAAVSAESCTPNTGSIDPGEAVSVELSVKNTGASNTVNLVGTVLPTGGVTSPGPSQAYGVVAAGGPAVARTFTFTADPALTCGESLTVTLSLQDGPSSLGTVTYGFRLGSLSNGSLTATHGTGNIATAIPDVSTVEIPIAVPDSGADAVGDVNVRLRLNHTFDADLTISLIHPDGTAVRLSTARGSSGDNFGTGSNDWSGSPTVFDDAAGAAIGDGIAPFAGSFRPEFPLAALTGKPTPGTWKLRISDTAAADVGTVGYVQLELNSRLYLCCPFTGGSPLVGGVPPATVAAESCSPGNGAPDPDETVTVDFPLQNFGTAPTTNLVATLLAAGGVNAPSGRQSYGALTPIGPPVSRSFTFVPSGTCGGDVTATLSLADEGGAGPMGAATFHLTLGATGPSTATFSTVGPITIPAGAPGLTSGAAAPYPSTIAVSGLTGTVSKVTVKLNGLSHTFPGDIDILLAGPGGQKLLLMSDVGGGTDAVNATLTFDDAAAPIGATVISGTFSPTNSGTGDVFPAPAPAGPYPDPQQLSVFNGSNPNGTWSLYVFDDAGADVGSIAGGWSLNITTAVPVCCQQACSLACAPDLMQPNDPGVCSAGVSFASAGVTGTCGIVACAPPSGSVFDVGTTVDTCTGTLTSDGTAAGTCSFDVTVNDVEPPVVSGATATPPVLWPPNHEMVDVAVGYTTGDNCGAVTTALAVSSDEPANGTGDGNTGPDWEIVDAHHVRLRAERAGGGDGRTYTITVTGTDAHGHSSSEAVTVAVPHDRR
jgi:subtilisin-like proprotein convertase family protein